MKDNLISSEEIKYLIANYLNVLTEREKKVISLRYNNEGEVQQTLSEITTVIHRTRERVRQIVIKNVCNKILKQTGDFFLWIKKKL